MSRAFSNLPLGTTPLLTDTVVGINNPSGDEPVDCQFTLGQLASVIEAQLADGIKHEMQALKARAAELERAPALIGSRRS
jgi:hypothetical protein